MTDNKHNPFQGGFVLGGTLPPPIGRDLPYRGAGNATVTVEIVTPERAFDWLTGPCRPTQRSISAGQVTALRGEIRRGAWQLTPDGVMFDKQGRLGNARHRLTAIFEEGVQVLMNVWRNVDDRVFDAIDGGRARSTAERLQMQGEPNAIRTTSIVRALLAADAGTNSIICTPNTVVEIANLLGRATLDKLAAIPGRKLVGPLAAVLWLGYPVNPTAIDASINMIIDRNFVPGPEAALVKFVTRKIESSASKLGRILARGVVAILQPARTIDQLSVTSDGWDELMKLRRNAKLPVDIVKRMRVNVTKPKNLTPR